MAGVWFRVAAWVRSNWIRTIPVVLVVALAAGVAGALAVGTRRTETAPDRYTAAYGGDPTVALYQPYGPPLTDVIRTAPGVAEAHGVTFVLAFPLDRSGNDVFDSNPFAGEDDFFGSRLVEGRFTAPGATDEFTVNQTEMDLLRGEVGETYDFVSYSQQQTDENDFDDNSSFDGPTFRATLVGIVTSSAEFEDSTPMLTFSDGFLPAHPGIGIVATIVGVRADPGVGVDTVMANVREATGGADLFQIESQIVAASARDAVDLQARALWVVTLVTLLAAALLTAQVVGRHLRATTGDRAALLALGYRPRQIAIEAALKGAGLGAIAAGIAAAVATVASTLFPIGAVRTFEFDPGPMVDPLVLVVGAIGLVVVAAASAAVGASRPDTSRIRSR
ncbi:MAG: FtsX-like permease family protein, partial [Ilumatobacter sp.]